ncbi:GTPase-activating protein and VPS9 domain-containing protein 1 [Armadillidium nasatum]|uniref:Receptor-mediated endocytosis protein 6 homolog n=1 Tax=Armadillidium nasatum TaxID=96803 RepID=A0A5N5SXL0_9CRUS|nr:GTPase-activating protein and VPS9 domain-containing protein 1 [Armadillidium nasatum]
MISSLYLYLLCGIKSTKMKINYFFTNSNVLEDDKMDKNISDLVHHLKYEKLFIDSERQHIENLNLKLMKTIEKVYQASFIRGEQRRNYNDLVLLPHSSPPACCQRANFLSQLQFIDGYQVLGYLETLFGEVLSGLRENPRLCAHCLVVGESISLELMQSAASTLMASVYGNYILPEDELCLLYLLSNLIELQLASSQNPRRLLLNGSCAFSQVYKTYIETLPQAKVFLTAALHEPIMQLLMEDELFLDIDPANAAGRFPQDERQRRFGKEGTKEYEEALSKYRVWTISKLVKITKRFIESIQQAFHCFPSTLAWLIRSVYETLMNSKVLDSRDISILCVDLVYTFFICSAVVAPEPQGIVDAPISHISRFNLIQVAQILQCLAMSKWEQPDPRTADLYDHFDKKALTALLDSIVNCGIPDQPPTSSGGNCPLFGLTRSAFMIPQSHLMQLIGFLFQIQEKLSEGSMPHKELGTVLSTIKPHFDQLQQQQQQQQSNCHQSGCSNYSSNHRTSPQGNHPEGTKGGSQVNSSQDSGITHGTSPSTSSKKNLLNRVRSSRKNKNLTISHDSSLEGHDDSVSQSSALTQSISNPSLHSQHSSSLEDREDCSSSLKYETVLVIPLPGNIGRRECPGMMSEDKVLYSLQGSKTVARIAKPAVEEGERVVVPSGGVGDGTIEKRTRFSLSHDEGSIGNTSDNLEAISEAASNHSVASSMDDVEQVDPPDNLSDMVSANVSGRGTPNVSGRDTPSSQITEGEEGGLRGAVEPPNRAQNIPVTVAKAASADIDEKFGRFEIKPIHGGGDETISLVSDTWSTDVLASDSEIIDPAERDREHLLDQHLVELDRMHGQTGGRGEFLRSGETFDTASEAWSMDVLASDSERLTEFDTDDAQSVARSDDTGRSEVEVDLAVVDGAGGGGGQAQSKSDGVSEDNLTPRPIMTSKSLDSEPTCEAASERAESEPSMGTLKAMSSDQKRGRRCIPVTKVNDETSPSSHLLCDNSSALTFKPIHPPPKDKDYINGDKDDNVLSSTHVKNETSGIQSLGRLTLNLSDLPCNGMVASGESLVFNQISSSKEAVNGFEEPKLSSHVTLLNGGLEKDLEETSQGTLDGRKPLVEDVNIHLSTVSLASSGSSESDGILQGTKVSFQQQESQQRQQQQSKELSSRPHAIEISPSVNCENDGHTLSGHGSSSSLSNLASTGAIPKSISFDKTAERGDKDSDSDSKHKKGFFKVFKLPAFKGRRKVSGTLSSRSDDYSFNRASLTSGDANIRRSFSEDNRRTILEESTDEILAKYRKKPETSETDGKQESNLEHSRPLPDRLKSEEEERPVDAFSESSFAFKDAKRKLRMVLSSADFYLTSNSIYFSTPEILQDRSLVAQLHETLRCLQLIDHEGRESVVHSLKDDYQSRSPYIAYLIRSRQGLLSSIDHLEKLLLKLETDTSIVMTSMVNVCVRMFLEKRDESLAQFTRNFMQLTVPDEKVELVESFLGRLYSELERDPMWLSSSSEQLSLAQSSLERSIMSHIYIHALYPNGDGDVSRDQVLFEHMKKLSEIITPGHKDLRIPKHYQYECPWPSAQAELTYLSAYKTSSDKVRCVVRTCKTIMNLLSMGHDSSIPAADDFIPVLVYVLIKANPPGLLSTVQYVDLFYEQRRLMGEDRYWWTQFCSSIEFIKTMDYTP